jgi:hypothetical protein
MPSQPISRECLMPVRPNISRAVVLALVIPLLATACFFRVWHLDNIPGFNGDEAYYGFMSLAILSGEHHTWTTPNGNLFNPFFFGPCILLHSFLPPSILIMRGIAAACGLSALLVNYVLCRRVFGWGTAIASTLLLAVLPENIAQSRFGWDPSQSVLVDAIVVYLSLLVVTDARRSVKWAVWTVAAFAASLLIHPTNGFVFPILLFAFIWRWRDRLSWVYPARPFTPLKLALYTACVLVIFSLSGPAQTKLGGGGRWAPETMRAFLPQAYADLFSGVTVYHYIPGSFLPSNTPAGVIILWTAASCAVFAAVLVFFLRRRPAAVPDGILFVGWAASVALFFAIAGAKAFSPGNERYGLCLIVPGVLVVCRSAILATASRPVLRFAAAAAGVLTCCALLGGFYVYYFRFIQITGGNSEPSFTTAAIDPKLAAWDSIQSRSAGTGAYFIVSSQYWNFEPLLYLSRTDKRAKIVLPDQLADRTFLSKLMGPIQAGRVWSVEFHDSDESAHVLSLLASIRANYSRREIDDYGGRPDLDVIRWHTPVR